MLANDVCWQLWWSELVLVTIGCARFADDKVRAVVNHLQVLRTSKRPDQRKNLALPHQQSRRPLRGLSTRSSRADLLI